MMIWRFLTRWCSWTQRAPMSNVTWTSQKYRLMRVATVKWFSVHGTSSLMCTHVTGQIPYSLVRRNSRRSSANKPIDLERNYNRKGKRNPVRKSNNNNQKGRRNESIIWNLLKMHKWCCTLGKFMGQGLWCAHTRLGVFVMSTIHPFWERTSSKNP